MSLATGNITGSGVAQIIVGRVGPGPSLVRIFSAKGALLRTIKGTIPGPLPNGVTVASADFDGDNYDDVAIGAGREPAAPRRPCVPRRPRPDSERRTRGCSRGLSRSRDTSC